jgi:hypothetical protein
MPASDVDDEEEASRRPAVLIEIAKRSVAKPFPLEPCIVGIDVIDSNSSHNRKMSGTPSERT